MEGGSLAFQQGNRRGFAGEVAFWVKSVDSDEPSAVSHVCGRGGATWDTGLRGILLRASQHTWGKALDSGRHALWGACTVRRGGYGAECCSRLVPCAASRRCRNHWWLSVAQNGHNCFAGAAYFLKW